MGDEAEKPHSGWGALLTNPAAIAAAASIATVIITQGVGYVQALQSRNAENLQQIELERLKFQIDLIKSSLSEQKAPEDRANTLLFLAEIGVLTGLNQEELVEWGKKTEGVPFFISSSGGTRPTGAMYRAAYGDDVYGPDTKAMHPTTAGIEEVLGPPGEPEGRCPPLVRIALPEPILAGVSSTETTTVTVHEAAAPYFEQAFANVHGAGLWAELRDFGGAYVARTIRGSSRPSQHSWGIAIDFDPLGNRIGAGADRYTMHPGVVTAFKDAGFAWSGDLDRPDAMGFILSTDTLASVRASGYTPSALGACPWSAP